METLSAFIPRPDDFTECIRACVAMQDSRQTRIHAAYWTLRSVAAPPGAAPGEPEESAVPCVQTETGASYEAARPASGGEPGEYLDDSYSAQRILRLIRLWDADDQDAPPSMYRNEQVSLAAFLVGRGIRAARGRPPAGEPEAQCSHAVGVPYCGQPGCHGFGRANYEKGWRFHDGEFRAPPSGPDQKEGRDGQ